MQGWAFAGSGQPHLPMNLFGGWRRELVVRAAGVKIVLVLVRVIVIE
jgi:hypothetical protein